MEGKSDSSPSLQGSNFEKDFPSPVKPKIAKTMASKESSLSYHNEGPQKGGKLSPRTEQYAAPQYAAPQYVMPPSTVYPTYTIPPQSTQKSFQEIYRQPRVLPSELLSQKTPKETQYLHTLNRVDHPGAVGSANLERVPLPMMERMPYNMPLGMAHLTPPPLPYLHIQLPHIEYPDVPGHVSRFTERILGAINGFIDDGKRLIPEIHCPKPNLNICAPKTQTVACDSCGYRTHYCPECGHDSLEQGAQLYRPPSLKQFHGVLVKEESACERLMRWHCSLFEDIGEAVDKELLCNSLGSIFREFGECVDNVVAEGIHGVAFNWMGLFAMIPGRSHTIVEGYAPYEPDPHWLRRERPTSATGNLYVDQVNAFLDACLSEPSMKAIEDGARVPDTQETGNWAVDTLNRSLDYLLQERELPRQAPHRKICPLEMLVPPCFRERPAPPPVEDQSCALLSCLSRQRECPTCHQNVSRRPGTCPFEGPLQNKCVVQLCPAPEPQVITRDMGPQLMYPYDPSMFQTQNPSGFVPFLDDSVPEKQMPVYYKPITA